MPFISLDDDGESFPAPIARGIIRIRPQAIDRPTPIRIFFNGQVSYACPTGIRFLETGEGLQWRKRSHFAQGNLKMRSHPYSRRLIDAIQIIQNPILRVSRPLPVPISLHGEPPIASV